MQAGERRLIFFRITLGNGNEFVTMLHGCRYGGE
jgi:hypothetical protein